MTLVDTPSEGLDAEGTAAPVPFTEVPFGPFILERRIAVGGSAEVFLARPREGTRPARQFVIKRLLPALLAAPEISSLEREAELHRRIRHPSVVTVFGAGRVADEPFLAMEYVEGVDAFRLMRFAQSEGRRFPPGLAVYIARRVAEALFAVHTLADSRGRALNVVHRDVTPSNIYLSIDGAVKLGDFGIARMEGRVSLPSAGGALKGKIGYLAPEQVSGDPVDARSDLFSLAVTLGELLIGERVFPGSGQLAVLLAIRDGNIEPLRAARQRMPSGLFPILERALAPRPERRIASGAELSRELAPFEQPSAAELREELAEWVRWARDSSRLADNLRGRIKDSVRRMRAARPTSDEPDTDARRAASLSPEGADAPDRESTELSLVKRQSGEVLRGVPFARLVEMIATGDLGPRDQVALMGAPLAAIEQIEDLARHLLPSTTGTTAHLYAPGTPDFVTDLADDPMLGLLARFRERRETGALFVDRFDLQGEHSRKEIYLRDGRLLHVASSIREELLGEYLVRRGVLARSDLVYALGQLQHYGGRLGDTLVSLKLVSGHDVFRAIRDQGRDRVAALCTWQVGRTTFYRDTLPTHVDFRLDLDLASPMMSGAIFLSEGDPCKLLPERSARLEPGPRHQLVLESAEERGTAPASMQRLPELAGRGSTLDECLHELTVRGDAGRVISATEAGAALIAARALGWIQF